MGTTSSTKKATNRKKRSVEVSYHTLKAQADHQVFKECELKLEEFALEFAVKRNSSVQRRHTAIGIDENPFDHDLHLHPRRQTLPNY